MTTVYHSYAIVHGRQMWQGDLNRHASDQPAVLISQIDSYRPQQHFGRADFSYGQFGENFTVLGLSDNEVCIGDRYASAKPSSRSPQPRVTCYGLAIYRVTMRLGEFELPDLLAHALRPPTGRPGANHG